MTNYRPGQSEFDPPGLNEIHRYGVVEVDLSQGLLCVRCYSDPEECEVGRKFHKETATILPVDPA